MSRPIRSASSRASARIAPRSLSGIVRALSEVEVRPDRRQGRPELVRCVAEEALERLVVLLERGQHLVEGDGQVADLVARPAGLDAGREVARERDRPCRVGHVSDRRQRAPGEDEPDDEREPDDDRTAERRVRC